MNDIKVFERTRDEIFLACIDLIKEVNNFTSALIEDDKCYDTQLAIRTSTEYICRYFAKFNSKFKRDKVFAKHDTFVAPREQTLGTRWNMTKAPHSSNQYPHLISNTFQYVPISETIRTLFERDDFCNAFKEFNYNKQEEGTHECKPGVYESFCCGDLYQNSELFRNQNETLQIHIASDDFQITNPLQSKSSIYKICAIYFTIQQIR